jgi:hypothetical protein
MHQNHNINANNSSKATQDCQDLNGIDLFKKSLEKYFFAKASIKSDITKKDLNSHLIISLNCNFSLTESLFHLNSGNWGGFCKSTNQLEYSGFELAVNELQEINTSDIVIKEIAIHFKDTSLFISKIPNQDITDQLCPVLTAISENFVHFTKGLTEMPYEIFVPVFEETTEVDNNVSWAMAKVRTSYFSYWGMYFHSEINQDSSVYDLKSKTIIDGDFFLLNKE